MVTLNDKEKKLLDSFIEELSDHMSNAGCNDFRFPDEWSDEEIAEFFKDVLKDRIVDEHFVGGRLTVDYVVLDVLRRKVLS